MKIKNVNPKIWNFQVVNGKDAWKEVVYSARMSGVPPEVKDEDVFKMIVENDYGSALEHIIIKFDIKMSKGNAPELLEHRMASHSGFSTRYIDANKSLVEDKNNVYEIILPWHIIKIMGEHDINKEVVEGYFRHGEKWEIYFKVHSVDVLERFLHPIATSIEKYDEILSNGLPRESARYVLPFCQAVGIYHFTINLRSLLNFLSLRLCVRASPEMRCIASQLYFNLVEQLPIIRTLVGCRGFVMKVCPESNVTGVRKGKQHPVYPPCPFKNKYSVKLRGKGLPAYSCFIPTKKELDEDSFPYGIGDSDIQVGVMEKIFRQWAKWDTK